jgi:ABC-type glycerol-3-phosphate transport system permease component
VTIFLERLLARVFFPERPTGCQVLLFLSTLVVATHYERELGLGNHNVLILMLLAWSLRLVLDRQEAFAGVLIALVILMKPHFLVLLPLLVLRRKVRTLASTAGCILVGIVFPAVFLGWAK